MVQPAAFGSKSNFMGLMKLQPRVGPLKALPDSSASYCSVIDAQTVELLKSRHAAIALLREKLQAALKVARSPNQDGKQKARVLWD
jgi:hypothetical protein